MDQIVFSTAAWTARLRDFLYDCAGSAPSGEIDRIREAMLLFLRDGRGPRRAGFDPAVVDAMLACGATESAALALIGGGEAFMLSRGPGGTCLATLVMPDGSDEVICEAATLSLALLSAYVSKLLTGLERKDPQDPIQIAPPSGMRLH